MPSRHNFRIDLTSNKPIAKLATHVATDQPYNLPNFDLDLGAPDYSTTLHSVPQLSPLPTSWSSPDDVLGGERERTESFFGGLYASQSVGELQDTLITQPYTSAWNSADATPYRDNNPTNLAVPAGKRFDASISERHLENSSGTDITKAVTHAVTLEPAQPITTGTSTTAVHAVAPPSPSVRAKHSGHHPTKSDLHNHIAPNTSILSHTSPISNTERNLNIAESEHKAKPLKRRLPYVLSRTKSLGADALMNKSTSSSAPSTPVRATAKHANGTPVDSDTTARFALPSQKERSMSKSGWKSSTRGRSEDRAGADNESSDMKAKAKKDKKTEKDRVADLHPLAKDYKKNNNSGFFGDFKSTSSKAADGLGKAGKGFFSRLTRSTSSNDKVGAGLDEEYDPRILKLPLVQQTRETRIAKSYDHCRDKTEFWMPALPWRCIDYLNGKCEEEGLYRVSGGLINVRRWRKRFDIERDVNLLDEPELYDASIIASLFKEWIRELPEEIFPKPLQAKVAATLPAEVPGTRPVPQALRDELSNLPPFNYYLLFAITCHLSLLLSHEPKNKMTLDNLYRCFNQSLKLDGRIFYTLVGDWRQCWQGCYTEDEYLRAEYEYLNTPYPEQYAEPERRATVANIMDERAMTSSSGSAASATGRSTPEDQRPATSHTQPSNVAVESDTEVKMPTRKQQRSSSDVTGLSPMRVRNSVNPH